MIKPILDILLGSALMIAGIFLPFEYSPLTALFCGTGFIYILEGATKLMYGTPAE